MNWITNTDTIIFNHTYNEKLDTNLISGFAKVIFSDYVLNEKSFNYYTTNSVVGAMRYALSEFNQDVSNLPSSITHLVFGHYFNQDISNLPSSITHLVFGHYFNQDISNLPHSLTHLTLGYCYDKQCSIPSNIKYLNLNCNNQYIIDSLPNSIVELELDYHFNLQMDNLPTSIKKLVIINISHYNKDLNCLPNFIEELYLNRHYKKRVTNIPSNLKKLSCHMNYPYKDDFRMCIADGYA